MLWLFRSFFIDLLGPAKRVTFNLAPVSTHGESIFLYITRFCSKAMYRHHPYWRTLLVLAHAYDTDRTGTLFASNVVLIALQTLTDYFSTKDSL